ncbi:MAG: IS3 family transposase [Lachnospiraceae bacterium]|nr:IS3 family transposase [Lachnospiraceae bacterium]
MTFLCELLGKSKQAYYKTDADRPLKQEIQSQSVLDFARSVRKKDPRIGSIKLWNMFNRDVESEFRLGRDKFIRILAENNVTLRKRSRKPRTTDSRHNYPLYPNLVRELIPVQPNEVWYSDITYVPTGLPKESQKWFYLSLITDGYSHEIIGWDLSRSLEHTSPLRALNMALKRLPQGHRLIHHSDRGVQYASFIYTNRLKANDVSISMTENGDPKENAVAERANGIIKNEILGGQAVGDYPEALKKIKEAIDFYNDERPHMSCGMLTPTEASRKTGKLTKQWRSLREKYLEADNIGEVAG